MANVSRYLAAFLRPASTIPVRQKIIRHLAVGGAGTACYFLAVTLQVELLSIAPVISVAIGQILLYVYTYFMNRIWVYGASNSHVQAVTRFAMLMAISFALNTGIMYLTTDVLNYWYFWGLVFAALIVPATNFVLSNYWVFK